MTDGHQRHQRPLGAAVGSQERPVLPAGALGRTGRLALLPLRHVARTAAAASRLSRAGADQVAARTAEQVFATLGELKGGAAKLGQAMSVFEAAMPEEVAAPDRYGACVGQPGPRSAHCSRVQHTGICGVVSRRPIRPAVARRVIASSIPKTAVAASGIV
jgi:hypothetical protein